jgi:uncharacterized protein (DUF2147 family)
MEDHMKQYYLIDLSARNFPSRTGIALAIGFAGSIAFFGCGDLARASEPSDPSGIWLVKDGDARIRIEHCPKPHEKVCGYIVWTKDGNSNDHDDKNPDVAKHNRAVLGMQMLMGLEKDGAAYSGLIYNAENGKTYDAHVTLKEPNSLTLKGCVMKYLCQSQTWTKVDDIAAGELIAATDAANGPRTDAEWALAKAPLRRPKR